MFPSYVMKAFKLMEAHDLPSEEALKELGDENTVKAEELARSLALCVSKTLECGSVEELVKSTELEKHMTGEVFSLFARQLVRVLVSAYWKGLRMSLHDGERQFLPEDMKKILEDADKLQPGSGSGA